MAVEVEVVAAVAVAVAVDEEDESDLLVEKYVLGGGWVMLTDSLITLQLTVSQSHMVLTTYPNPDDSKSLER